jgi:hypothetical protein
VFSKVHERLIALAKSRMRAISCTGCGHTFKPFADQEIVSLSDLIGPATCPTCGREAQVFHLSEAGSEEALVRDELPPKPDDLRITRRDVSASERLYHVPASGKGGFLLFFAAVWNGMLVFMGVMVLAGSSETPAISPMTGVFLLPFLLVGITVAYLALRAKYAVHLLFLGNEFIRLQRQLFGRTTDYQLSTAEITGVELKVFYQENYRPVHGIEIVAGKKKIRFGSALKAAEKQWLCAEIREYLRAAGNVSMADGGAEPRAEERNPFPVTSPAAALPTTRVRRESAGSDHTVFHIAEGGRWGGWLLAALFGTGILAAIIYFAGGSIFPSHPDSAEPFGAVFTVFSIAFGLAHLMMLLLGLVLTGLLWRAALRQRFLRQQVTIDRVELRLDEMMFGRKKSRSLPVREITRVQLQEILKQDGKPRRAVRVATNRQSFWFGLSLPEADKAALVSQLRELAADRGAPVK